jgi:hypothetical protein
MNDLEKIGVKKIKPFVKDGRWVFEINSKIYDMAPAQITEVYLSPLVIGIDKIIVSGCKIKGIKNPENGFNLLFSEQYFPNADVKFNFTEQKFNGWIYSVEELNLKGLRPDQSAWICSYMSLYFSSPPKTIYIKAEDLEEKYEN